MSNKQSINPKNLGLTPYQKRAVKDLQKLLDTHTPFYFDKTSSNHLRFYIEGVDQPITTSSTPSDRNAHKAFIARVKSHLRPQPEVFSSDAEAPETRRSMQEAAMVQYLDKIKTNVVRDLRHRQASLQSKEQTLLAQTQTLESIQAQRLALVKEGITHAMRQRQKPAYIKPKLMRDLEKEILRHLNFMLPTLANYAQELKPETSSQQPPEIEVISNQAATDNTLINKPLVEQITTDEASPHVDQETEPAIEPTKVKPSIELMEQAQAQRLETLSQYSRAQLLQLAQEIEQALALKQSQEIAQLVAEIKAKGYPIEQVIAQLQAA